MFFGSLGASLSGSILADEGTTRACESTIISDQNF